MERREFLGKLIGGVAATAAVRTWPFRVYSFPSNIEIVPCETVKGIEWIRRSTLQMMLKDLKFIRYTPADVDRICLT